MSVLMCFWPAWDNADLALYLTRAPKRKLRFSRSCPALSSLERFPLAGLDNGTVSKLSKQATCSHSSSAIRTSTTTAAVLLLCPLTSRFEQVNKEAKETPVNFTHTLGRIFRLPCRVDN